MTTDGLLQAASDVFNNLFPVLAVALGIVYGVGMISLFTRELRRTIDYTIDNETPQERDQRMARLNAETRAYAEELEKPKNDDNLALLDQPDKPKRMFVRLGDDGELVEWSGEHETNRQV